MSAMDDTTKAALKRAVAELVAGGDSEAAEAVANLVAKAEDDDGKKKPS